MVVSIAPGRPVPGVQVLTQSRMPGFAKSIDVNLDVGGAWKIYTFSCLYGFFISALVYYLTCKYVSDVGPAKIEEAVLPPQKGDRPADIETLEGEIYEEKGVGDVDVGVKEISGSPKLG